MRHSISPASAISGRRELAGTSKSLAETVADMSYKRQNLKRRATQLVYQSDNPPIEVPIKKFLEQVARECVIPPEENPKGFRSFLLARETEIFAKDLFWHVHCTLFQADADAQLEFLASRISATLARNVSTSNGRQPANTKYLPYALGRAIAWCYKHLFPGSASIRTVKFVEDVMRVLVLLFTGMELARGAHRQVCERAKIPAFQGERPRSAISFKPRDVEGPPPVTFPSKRAKVNRTDSWQTPVFASAETDASVFLTSVNLTPQHGPTPSPVPTLGLSQTPGSIPNISVISPLSSHDDSEDDGEEIAPPRAVNRHDADTKALRRAERKLRGSTLTKGIRYGIQKFDVFQLSPLMQKYASRIPSVGHRPRMIRRSVRDDDAPALLGTKFASLGMSHHDEHLYENIYERVGEPVDYEVFDRVVKITKRALVANRESYEAQVERLDRMAKSAIKQAGTILDAKVGAMVACARPKSDSYDTPRQHLPHIRNPVAMGERPEKLSPAFSTSRRFSGTVQRNVSIHTL